LQLGRGKWHATMLIARYNPVRGSVDLMFAGHNAPFLLNGDGAVSTNVSSIAGASNILGIDPDFKPVLTTIAFPKGAHLLLFTDGLVDARSPSGKTLSRK